MLLLPHIAIALTAQSATLPTVPTIVIDRDNITITQSCIAKIGARPIVDADGTGVIQITGNDITVVFAPDSPALHGARSDQLPDSFAGTGIVITGRNVTLAGAKVGGYKVGIHAIKADGLTIRDTDVSGNFAQRLKSTPQAEDGGDWLWPHANDDNEWITNYGAGLCVEDSTNVTLHDIRARKTQNGIILDAVNDSKVYDCDCSFLSGWGLAMWRSSRNIISRNAFDFCVRGYSHGVYNRGQDSAGILMFEQCCENVIAENSATHGGDGFFGFAGKEALGEVNPRDDMEWYKRRGNNDNLIFGNDFSDAVAHGIELTFSFGNVMYMNHLLRDGICGVWAGYSNDSYIAHNFIEDCGEMAYGLERGGINIEHGSRNEIWGNCFRRNKCAIHFWNDDDPGLAATPWGRANDVVATDNASQNNLFDANALDYHLRGAKDTSLGMNIPHHASAARIERDESATIRNPPRPIVERSIDFPRRPGTLTDFPTVNKLLAGREHIIMTEWGPWDHESPLLQFVRRFDHGDEYRLLGTRLNPTAEQIAVEGDVLVDVHEGVIRISPRAEDALIPYRLSFKAEGEPMEARGVLTGGTWLVKTFASPADPRSDVEAWRKGATGESVHTLTADSLDFAFGGGGMSEARGLPVKLPSDHFGVIATRSLKLPAGKYRLSTTSDDGIRVWLDDRLVIDDWTWHAPAKHDFEFEITHEREATFRVEYFELDGHAVLQVDFVTDSDQP